MRKKPADAFSKAAADDGRQQGFYARHLQPLMQALVALPLKKGRAFWLENDFISPPAGKPALSVEYIGGRAQHPALLLVMDDYKDDTDFTMRVCRTDGAAQDRVITTVKTVAQMQAVIHEFVALVAPDRVAELQAAKPRKPSRKI